VKRLAPFLLLIFASGQPAPAEARTEAEQRALWDRGQAEQRKFEHRLFTDAGFQSIAEVRADGHDVRRLLLEDPYMILPVPGLELERLSDGQVTLRVQYRGWSSKPVPVDRAAWEELARHEATAFARPEFRPMPTQLASAMPPPPICHGWIVRLEADYQRSASWAECGGKEGPVHAYALRMIALAIATRPECTLEPNNPFWSFSKCFGAKASLDDPELDAQFAELRKQFDEAPGADRLSEARQALIAPGIAMGNKQWLDAREAIRKFSDVEEGRRQALRKLQELSGKAAKASDADKAKIRQTIAAWSDFLRSQEHNYAELLQSLAWPSSR
jgi:hypothetical protein